MPIASGKPKCGKDRWRSEVPGLEARFRSVSDASLWRLRARARRKLVEYVRERLVVQWAERGLPTAEGLRTEDVLDPDRLTLGFARRFASYKRPNLLLHDAERLVRDPPRPRAAGAAGRGRQGPSARRCRPADDSRMDGVPRTARCAAVRRLSERLRHAHGRRARAGNRRVDQHAAPPVGGVRNERNEGARQRRPEPFGAGRLVGRSLLAGRRLGDRRLAGTRQRSRVGCRGGRRPLHLPRAAGRPRVLHARQPRHLARVGRADARKHGPAHAGVFSQPHRTRVHRSVSTCPELQRMRRGPPTTPDLAPTSRPGARNLRGNGRACDSATSQPHATAIATSWKSRCI